MQHLLSRDKVSDEGAQTFARQAFLQRTIEKEWVNLLDTADSTISKMLIKAVKESTSNAGIKIDLAGTFQNRTIYQAASTEY